jgi:hypothetical protein
VTDLEQIHAKGRAHLIVSADVDSALDLEPIGSAVRETLANVAPGLTFSYDLYAVRGAIRAGGNDEENG